MPLGASKSALLAMGGAGGGNYFGDGSDGAVTTSGDLTYTVANKSGSYDGDMVVKNYTSLTISTGDTVTTDQPCRGMLIYVKGDCSITGTLSAQVGALADPTNTGGSDSAAVNASGLRLPMLTASGTDTLAAADFAGCGTAAVAAVGNQPEIAGDGTIYQIVKTGAAGGNAHGFGAPASNFTRSPGTVGAQGTTTATSGQCGGGATGGYAVHGGNSGFTVQGATGGLGGAFSGGAGGGGLSWRISSQPGYQHQVLGPPADYGGAGVSGQYNWSATYGSSGGAGNPAGADVGDNVTSTTQSICGGILWLVVKGDLTINVGGIITAAGGNTGNVGSSGQQGSTGGGSGGGVLMLLHGGTYTNNGTVSAAGGVRGAYNEATQSQGANGGDGSVITSQVED